MSKEDFLSTMTILGMAYDKEFTKNQIEVWYSILKDYTIEEFSMAIQDLIKTEKFLPTIAHITEQIAKNKTSSIPDAEEEWQEVLSTVHRFGSYREQDALASLKPYTAKIVSYIGYFRICTASPEEQTWNKKEFIGEYNSLKDKEVINLQIGSDERKLLSD